jgi:hypothetical protein
MIEYDIIGAFRESVDCPICTVVAGCSDKYIRWFLMENYSQASTLINLSEGGFCRDHAYKIAGLSTHQLSVTYEFIVKDLANKTAKARENHPDKIPSRGKREKQRFDVLKRQKPCPLCDTIAFYEKYAGRVALQLLSEAQYKDLFQKSTGFCRDHLLQVLELATPELEDFLLDDYRSRLEKLSAEFQEYFRKMEYRDASEPRGTEQDAWKRAINLIHGKP